MQSSPPPRLGSAARPPSDGWLGLRELPGYRAGRVVVRLEDLPAVDPKHLYFDALLLDPGGRTQDFHAGPCVALGRGQSVDERSRFVRIVAELVRHAPGQDGGLTAIGHALSYVRERGVETERLVTAAQLLDNVSSESAVVASLSDMLELSLGIDEAWREMSGVVSRLAGTPGFGALDARLADAPPANWGGADPVDWINGGGLTRQLSFIVRTLGKSQARRYLRQVTDFAMVPTPAMLGL